jgi:hypothetical protein
MMSVKNVEGSGHGVKFDTAQAFIWRNWDKPLQILTKTVSPWILFQV